MSGCINKLMTTHADGDCKGLTGPPYRVVQLTYCCKIAIAFIDRNYGLPILVQLNRKKSQRLWIRAACETSDPLSSCCEMTTAIAEELN